MKIDSHNEQKKVVKNCQAKKNLEIPTKDPSSRPSPESMVIPSPETRHLSAPRKMVAKGGPSDSGGFRTWADIWGPIFQVFWLFS